MGDILPELKVFIGALPSLYTGTMPGTKDGDVQLYATEGGFKAVQ
jgi:hypothetical protein